MRWRVVGWMAVAWMIVFPAARPAWAIRPLFTEDPAPVGAGKVELELGGEYAKNDTEDGGIVAKLTVGALPWFDVAYEGAVRVVAPADEPSHAGYADSTLMLKTAWPSAGPRPGLGAVLNLRLPTGDPDRGLGDEGADVLVRGIVGQTFGPVTAFGNVGYTFVTDDRDLDTWFFSAALTASATEKLLLMGEVVSIVSVDQAETQVLGRLGIAYAFTERLRADLGVGFGLSRAAPDVVVTVGVTIVLR